MEKKENPNNIEVSIYITDDSFTCYDVDNTFCTFNSVNDILYLIYSKRNTIIFYNLIDNQIINTIKNAHNSNIVNIRHYLDKNNKIDYAITLSFYDNNIKLWNINNYECLFDITKNSETKLYSACFVNQNSNIYIVAFYKPITVFDIKGNEIKVIIQKELNNLIIDYKNIFIDNYFDKKKSKNYIFTNNFWTNSYDFDTNLQYRTYKTTSYQYEMNISLAINFHENLIGSTNYGQILVWNLHSGVLLFAIKTSNKRYHIEEYNYLYGICIWDNEYIFVGGGNKTIRLIDLKTRKVVKILKGHNDKVLTIKKIYHPIYKDCILSNSFNEIKLWKNQNL